MAIKPSSTPLQTLLWRGVITGVTLFIFWLAVKTLYGLTQSIEPSEVIHAITQIPVSSLVWATIVVAFGYLILTLYDAIAFKHIGVHLPFPKVAMTSFTAYAIGHTIGLAVLSASGVRYRMYRANNVKRADIGNVIWLVAMAFTFGISTLVALTLAFTPEATVIMLAQLDTHLSETMVGVPEFMESVAFVRALGLAMLAVILGIVAWSGRQGRHIKIKGWRFDLPTDTMLAKQIIISIVDMASVAFVLYLLLPHGGASDSVDFLTVFSAFIQSMILGILSHVPGGLGVFELTMMASLPQVDTAYLLAVLLIFRLLYYIVPFLLAVLFFVAHEVWLQTRQRKFKSATVNNRKTP